MSEIQQEKEAQAFEVSSYHLYIESLYKLNKMELINLQNRIDLDQDKFMCIIKNTWSSEKCKTLIALCEKQGFTDYHINKSGQMFNDPNIRDEQDLHLNNAILSNEIFNQIKEFLPKSQNYTCLNCDLLRISKYRPGNKCVPHFDSTFISTNMKSNLTVMIYLNNSDGATRFFNVNNMKYFDIIPECGKIVIFDQTITHAILSPSNIKYTLQSDICFKFYEPKEQSNTWI